MSWSGERFYTVAQVSAACGLPQPVVAQCVARTMTPDGWMYTEEQLQEAKRLAQEWLDHQE